MAPRRNARPSAGGRDSLRGTSPELPPPEMPSLLRFEPATIGGAGNLPELLPPRGLGGTTACFPFARSEGNCGGGRWRGSSSSEESTGEAADGGVGGGEGCVAVARCASLDSRTIKSLPLDDAGGGGGRSCNDHKGGGLGRGGGKRSSTSEECTAPIAMPAHEGARASA